MRSNRCIATVCLLIGAVAGLVLGTAGVAPFHRPASAEALTRAESDALYHELGQPHALQESSRLLAKIARLTTPSVVHIQSERQGPRGRIEETGSGVIIRHENGGTYVVTNRHVVADAALKHVSIRLHDGRVLQPTSVKTDGPSDIAVLAVSGNDLQAARWGDSDALEIGHLVLAMGSPFGLSQSVTLGIISAKGRRSLPLGGASAGIINQDFLQTDAAINPGNSGGPLIDLQGRIVGINTAIASNSGGNEGIGFSIPSNLVRRVVNQLLTHGEVRRAYLGVMLDPEFDTATARRLKLDRLHGARVTRVMPGTPAARANLRADDVILSFDGADVQDENHLINLVSLSPVGKRVRVVIQRDGKRMTVEVVLTSREDDLHSAAPPPIVPSEPRFRVEPMGLTIEELTTPARRGLGIGPHRNGVLVTRVGATASAAGSGLHAGDVISHVNGRPVADVSSFEAAWATATKRAADAPVLLRVLRLNSRGRSEERLISLAPPQPEKAPQL